MRGSIHIYHHILILHPTVESPTPAHQLMTVTAVPPPLSTHLCHPFAPQHAHKGRAQRAPLRLLRVSQALRHHQRSHWFPADGGQTFICPVCAKLFKTRFSSTSTTNCSTQPPSKRWPPSAPSKVLGKHQAVHQFNTPPCALRGHQAAHQQAADKHQRRERQTAV